MSQALLCDLKMGALSQDQRAHQRKMLAEGRPTVYDDRPDLSLWEERVYGLYQRLSTERPVISGGFAVAFGPIPESKLMEGIAAHGATHPSEVEELRYLIRDLESEESEFRAKEAQRKAPAK